MFRRSRENFETEHRDRPFTHTHTWSSVTTQSPKSLHTSSGEENTSAVEKNVVLAAKQEKL